MSRPASKLPPPPAPQVAQERLDHARTPARHENALAAIAKRRETHPGRRPHPQKPAFQSCGLPIITLSSSNPIACARPTVGSSPGFGAGESGRVSALPRPLGFSASMRARCANTCFAVNFRVRFADEARAATPACGGFRAPRCWHDSRAPRSSMIPLPPGQSPGMALDAAPDFCSSCFRPGHNTRAASSCAHYECAGVSSGTLKPHLAREHGSCRGSTSVMAARWGFVAHITGRKGSHDA